jgi:hypothetical protein
MNNATGTRYVVRYTFHGQTRESVTFPTRIDATAALQALAKIGHYGRIEAA